MSLRWIRRATRSQEWLESAGDRLQPVVATALSRLPRAGRDFLDGVWLGTPLHPPLTDVPLGAWTAAMALDAADGAAASPALRRSADGALAVGVAGAVGAAATGLADYRYLRGDTRRIGTLHALMNTVGLTLNVTSLVLRRQGRRDAARALSGAAFAGALVAAHLGGQLSFGLGVRVNRTATTAGPDAWTPVAGEGDMQGPELRRVSAEGTAVVLTRSRAGELCAIAATCSHLSGPLDEGSREGDTVVCPWHGSRFDLCSGDVLGGPAVHEQPRYETRVVDGTVEVRLAQ